MNRTRTSSGEIGALNNSTAVSDIDAFCRATPKLTLVLRPDLTIVDANDAYLRATLVWREEIRGCGIFDVFPDNPHEATANGVANLRASLYQVLKHGRPHRMTIQQYDVRDRVAGDGSWVEKFWAPINSPVFGSGSREIVYLLHQVTDVTQAMALRQWLAEEALILAEQRATLGRMRTALVQRRRDLRAARRSLTALLQAGSPHDESLEPLRRQLAALDARRYGASGEQVPVAGLYRVFHQRACRFARSRIYLRAGRVFPPCRHCQTPVLYALIRRVDGTMDPCSF